MHKSAKIKFQPFTDLFNLLFPNLCLVCGNNLLKSEQQICFSCLHALPETNFHLQTDNPIEKRFWGKVPIYRATALFFFQKGSPFQSLLHALKYRGNKEIGEVLGKYAGVALLDSSDFCTIDVIIPVPLHPQKYRKRGYNQSELIAQGLSAAMNKPVDTTSLIRVRENTTQTKKNVFERYENTEGIFELKNKNTVMGLHVLIVDDVLTTGSTIEACIKALIKTENIKVSVFTMAVA
jgi:ComF family protein